MSLFRPTPNLLHKRALITGGSRGLGLGIAHRLAASGASCVLLSRTSSQLQSAVAALPVIHGRESGGGRGGSGGGAGESGFRAQEHSFVVGDVGDVEFWEDVRRREKDIDILINAAGVGQYSLLMTTSAEVVRRVVQVNLLGTVFGCRAMCRGMVKRKEGCIINISSALALKGGTGSTIYAASKAGVLGFTRALAEELGPKHVRVNAIVPGYIKTAMTESMSEGFAEGVLKKTAVGRMGSVEEVADAAAFLVGNGFCNGSQVVVDGGLGSM